jgi:hypothetical protein
LAQVPPAFEFPRDRASRPVARLVDGSVQVSSRVLDEDISPRTEARVDPTAPVPTVTRAGSVRQQHEHPDHARAEARKRKLYPALHMAME